MTLDLNDAETQQGFDLIPDNTVAPMVLTLRPGGQGEGGWLKPTKSGNAKMLDVEFTVSAGPFARRKLWKAMIVEGNGSDGHNKAENITKSTLRGIVESAHNIRSDDSGEAANKKRMLQSWGDLDGLDFVGLIGIEKGEGTYPDKNTLKAVITPSDKRYAQAKASGSQMSMGTVTQAVAAKATASSAAKPAWMQ